MFNALVGRTSRHLKNATSGVRRRSPKVSEHRPPTSVIARTQIDERNAMDANLQLEEAEGDVANVSLQELRCLPCWPRDTLRTSHGTGLHMPLGSGHS